MKKFALLVFLSSCAACPVNQTPHQVDGGPLVTWDQSSDPCSAACNNLTALGCAEGTAQCLPVCDHILDAGLREFHADLISSAKSKEDVRAANSGIDCP